jgi:hypothetical protein
MTDDALEEIILPFLTADLARDVATVYLERRQQGVDPGYATQGVFETFRDLLVDPNEGPVVFLAIAALQLREGVVLGAIRDGAIAMIDSGEAQRAWRQTDVTINNQRRAALKALAERLEAVDVV